MKKIIFIFALSLFTVLSSAQNWNVTFHPAEKRVSVPSYHACIYEDATYELQLRSDMPFIKVIMNEPAFNECNDSVTVELFTSSGEMKYMITSYVNIGDDVSATVYSQRAVDWLMNGGKIKIIFKKKGGSVIVLRIDCMDRQRIIAQYYKHLNDIKG